MCVVLFLVFVTTVLMLGGSDSTSWLAPVSLKSIENKTSLWSPGEENANAVTYPSQLIKETINPNMELPSSFSDPISPGETEKSNIFKNKTNILFVKTHKCGTSTLVNMFYLYGIRRKLNFVVAPYQHQIPPSVSPDKLVPPRSNQSYNMQVQHFHGFGGFYSDEEHAILPKSHTIYTSIIRSPVSRFLSSFVYYGHYQRLVKV